MADSRPGVILDCDAAGDLVSLERLNAPQCVENPAVIDLAVVGQA